MDYEKRVCVFCFYTLNSWHLIFQMMQICEAKVQIASTKIYYRSIGPNRLIEPNRLICPNGFIEPNELIGPNGLIGPNELTMPN